MLDNLEIKSGLEPFAVVAHSALVAQLSDVVYHETYVEEKQDDEAVLELVFVVKVVVLACEDQEEEPMINEVDQEGVNRVADVLVSLLHVICQLV